MIVRTKPSITRPLLLATLVAFLVTALFVAIALAYPGQQLWVQRYNGTANGDDVGNSMVLDSSGNAYVAGTATNTGSGKDFIVIKMSPTGVYKWWRTYNGTGNADDEGAAITRDRFGNVYVTGTSQGLHSRDIVTIKYDQAGNKRWARRYSGPEGNDWANGVAVDAYGYAYVAGASQGGGQDDAVILKYTPGGGQAWIRRYTSPAYGPAGASAILLDKNRNIYTVGAQAGFVSESDYLTLSYTTGGALRWARRYDGPSHLFDWSYCITRDGQGNVFVGGFSDNPGTRDIVVVKYDSLGHQKWARRYDTPTHDVEGINAISANAAGDLYIAGSTGHLGTLYDYLTIKYGPTGTLKWVRRYDGPDLDNDYATNLALDAGGNIYVTGVSKRDATGDDWVTLKYTPTGVRFWAKRYDGPGHGADGPWAIRVRTGAIYVAGYSTGASTSAFDITTVKYAP